MRYSLLFLILSTLLGCTACDPAGIDCPDELEFDIPVSFLNPKDTFNIGDTIWSEVRFSKTLVDKKAGIETTFEPNNLPTTFYFLHRIDSTLEQFGQFNIRIIDKIGHHIYAPLSGGVDNYILEYRPVEKQYHFIMGLIIKEPGLFTLQIALDHDFRYKAPGPCRKNVFWSFVQSVKDTNFEMTQNSPLLFWKTYKKAEWERTAGYCFYVKRR
jgi:hypothetical protein